MYIKDMLVTLEKVSASSGKAQLVFTIDQNSIQELPRLVGFTGQLMAIDLYTSQQELPLDGTETAE